MGEEGGGEMGGLRERERKKDRERKEGRERKE